MSSTAIHFYDSANAHNVPSGVHAAVYINGFRWDKEDIDRMKAIKSVSVERAAAFAELAAIIDVENGAALPEDVPPFLKQRIHTRHDDGTAYVNRSNWGDVIERVESAKVPQPFYWVATLDGTTEVEITVNGKRYTAWAVQYQGGGNAPFDLSILHGKNTFHRP